MGNKRLVIYLHLIWGIQEGSHLISKDIERPLYRCIVNQVNRTRCQVLAINGVLDHVHLVVKMRSTVAVSDLVKRAKGVSSKYINEQFFLSGRFRWQKGYGAFSISRWDLHKIINYVKKQKTHHNVGSLVDYLE